jgi:hypothetical protein
MHKLGHFIVSKLHLWTAEQASFEPEYVMKYNILPKALIIEEIISK